MEAATLENAGLTASESRIYLALLKSGSCKAGRIAKDTGLNRTTVYKALERLIQHGIVSSAVKENRQYFQAADPDNLLAGVESEEKQLSRKREEIQKLLPGLHTLYESSKDESEIKIFKGVRGLKTVFNDMLNHLQKNDTYLAFGVPEHAQQFWGYFEKFNQTLEEKGIHSKIIFDERATENIASCKKFGYEVRTLSKEFMSPAEVNIYKDRAAIMLWDEPLAILIQSESIARSFTQYFKLLWNMAKVTS